MSVPANVPENVPVGERAKSPPTPNNRTAAHRGGAPSYLTGSPEGWRFQWRIPKQFSCQVDKNRTTIRAWIGPGRRRDAEHLARHLASACQIILARVDVRVMSETVQDQSDDFGSKLYDQVSTACHSLIDRFRAHPSSALPMAGELQSVINTLNLVHAERHKGAGGMSAIVNNADSLVIGALEKIVTAPLQNPFAGPAGLTDHLIPAPVFRATQDAARRELAPQPIKADTSTAPLFSQVSQEYIDMRIAADGEEHPDIQYLRLRRQTFLDLVDDRPVDQYSPKDLQDYVNEMQFWPANTTKRAEFDNLSTRQICNINHSLRLKPLARKTLEEGYLANVKTMARHGMTIYEYRDPFAGARLHYPGTLRASVARETIGDDILGRAFKSGVESGFLEDAILPILAYLTGRRIGLLLYLQGSDLRQKNGVWIAQTDGIVKTKTGFQRVPVKTADSLKFFVLHDFLAEIGFTDWASQRPGFIFEAAHEHDNPSKYVSRNLNRLLTRNGAVGKNVEVIHSLRHGKIDEMRSKKVGANQARQQSGHAAAKDEHDKYGSKTEMSPADVKKMATSRLPKTIDWSVFQGLDFDALAAGRRKRGAPIKRHAPSSSNDKTS